MSVTIKLPVDTFDGDLLYDVRYEQIRVNGSDDDPWGPDRIFVGHIVVNDVIIFTTPESSIGGCSHGRAAGWNKIHMSIFEHISSLIG